MGLAFLEKFEESPALQQTLSLRSVWQHEKMTSNVAGSFEACFINKLCKFAYAYRRQVYAVKTESRCSSKSKDPQQE
jgi:hypothetical protein